MFWGIMCVSIQTIKLNNINKKENLSFDDIPHLFVICQPYLQLHKLNINEWYPNKI